MTSKAYLRSAVAAGFIGLSLAGCKPADAPPDLLKTQRAALEKAKALEGQMQQQAQERMKAIDDVQK
jgi:hypothetical protein